MIKLVKICKNVHDEFKEMNDRDIIDVMIKCKQERGSVRIGRDH